jgi:single-strand DNA-binding protein
MPTAPQETGFDLNVIFLIGNLGTDPDIRYFEGGSCKAKFSIAVEVWNKDAEFAANYLTKGREVSIQGALDFQAWVDKENNNRSTPFIRVRELTLLPQREKRVAEEY